MPPKAKFTKDEMINVALAITRRSGIETVTARKMATELGVSTRPIFTYFKSIDELKRAVHARAMCVYRERIKEGLNSDIPFLGIGMRYLGFAKDEPNLYKLLYLSSDKYSDGNSAIELVKYTQELIRDTLMKIYNMTAEQAEAAQKQNQRQVVPQGKYTVAQISEAIQGIMTQKRAALGI